MPVTSVAWRLGGALLWPVVVLAQGVTVEAVAERIASDHNKRAAAMLDGMTLSTSARAQGRQVVLSYILDVRRDLPERQVAEFKAATIAEVVPPACRANATNPAFAKGLSYRFVYESSYRQRLAEFVVDQQACAPLLKP